MSTPGCMDEFYIESGNMLTYLDCVEQFFIENDITHGTETETKSKAILFSTIGEKIYRILEDLLTPQNLSEKSFEVIKHLLLEHFKPKHLVIAESYQFYNAKQDKGKFISNFFVHFKHLSSTCKFGTFLKRSNLCVG